MLLDRLDLLSNSDCWLRIDTKLAVGQCRLEAHGTLGNPFESWDGNPMLPFMCRQQRQMCIRDSSQAVTVSYMAHCNYLLVL